MPKVKPITIFKNKTLRGLHDFIVKSEIIDARLYRTFVMLVEVVDNTPQPTPSSQEPSRCRVELYGSNSNTENAIWTKLTNLGGPGELAAYGEKGKYSPKSADRYPYYQLRLITVPVGTTEGCNMTINAFGTLYEEN